MSEEELLTLLIDRFEKVDIKWTVSNHAKIIKDFNDRLESLEFRNPRDRVQLYEDVRVA
jgi:hypothetical protein